MTKSIVDLAEETVSIVQVCELIGMEGVTDSGRAIKYYCPFSELYHSNPSEKAFRVYTGTNSAYCFGGCGYFSVVSLYAKAEDFVTQEGKLRMRDAAKDLLDRVGYQETNHYSLNVLERPKAPPVNTKALGQALELFLKNRVEEAKPDNVKAAADVYEQLLGLLPQVKDDESADRWMAVGRQAIIQSLGLDRESS